MLTSGVPQHARKGREQIARREKDRLYYSGCDRRQGDDAQSAAQVPGYVYVHTQLKPAIPLTKPKTIHNLLRQIHVNYIRLIKDETRICLIMTRSMNTYGA